MGILNWVFNPKTADDLAKGEVEIYAAVHDDGRTAYVDKSADSVAKFAADNGLCIQRFAARPIGGPMKGQMTFSE